MNGSTWNTLFLCYFTVFRCFLSFLISSTHFFYIKPYVLAGRNVDTFWLILRMAVGFLYRVARWQNIIYLFFFKTKKADWGAREAHEGTRHITSVNNSRARALRGATRSGYKWTATRVTDSFYCAETLISTNFYQNNNIFQHKTCVRELLTLEPTGGNLTFSLWVGELLAKLECNCNPQFFSLFLRGW